MLTEFTSLTLQYIANCSRSNVASVGELLTDQAVLLIAEAEFLRPAIEVCYTDASGDNRREIAEI